MKILYIVHRIPYPPNKGDKIRSFNEIKYLSEKHEIHLCCLADTPQDLQRGSTLKAYCKSVTIIPINRTLSKLKTIRCVFSNMPLSVPYFYARKLQMAVNQLLETITFDYIFCLSSAMAEYVFRAYSDETKASRQQTAIRIMDFVDVDSDKWLQYSQHEKWPLSWIHRMEGRRLAEYERKISEWFDHSIFVSTSELAIFKSYCSNVKNAVVIPNGVDFEYFSPSSALSLTIDDGQLFRDKSRPLLLFTGAMDYYPNVEGITWFCSEILPSILAEYHDLMFYIVGSNPHPRVRSLQKDNGIRVTGFVEDIRPYYYSADVCVVPLRLARGVQNKVLEAMAMGKPVVTTSKGVQGFETIPEHHLLVGDTPEDFAHKVIDLLKNERRRKEVGQSNRKWVKNNYQWSINMDMLERLIE